MLDSAQFALRNRQSAIEDAPLLDAQAKAAYRARLRDLRDELDEAQRFNDLGRTATLQAEMDFISQQLSAAVGLHGRDRKSGAAERARLMVTKRIKAALTAISVVHVPLAQHLRTCVKTGYVCVYTPSSPPMRWEI
jgi:non-specific serine/threonine protein kinase